MDQQVERHLIPLLEGNVLGCQGVSEPGAGSDLAALGTRAVRDGADYIVNGQKIWTTNAHWADWMFALVRTSSEGRRQAGISFLLIDMTSPGIRSEEHTSELQSLMRISYAVFCLNKKNNIISHKNKN